MCEDIWFGSIPQLPSKISALSSPLPCRVLELARDAAIIADLTLTEMMYLDHAHNSECCSCT